MRRSMIVAALILGLLPAHLSGLALAGGKGKGGGGKTEHWITVSPESVGSPVTPADPLTICLGGFAQGNFVSVQVPMTGDPDFHSMVSFSSYVGATGGFCFTSPPDWGQLVLSPGPYTIRSYWRRDGHSRRRDGPTASFTVQPI